MRTKAGMTIAIAILICLLLDAVVFAKLNIADIRPDVVIALAVALGITVGSLHAGLICGGIGLLWDIMFYKVIGLNAAIYLLAGLVCGCFFRKFYADNAIIPALLGFCISFVKDNVYAIVVAIGGGGYNYGLLLLTYILPCALFTGIMCIPAYYSLKPLLARYGKYLSEKHNEFS